MRLGSVLSNLRQVDEPSEMVGFWGKAVSL